MKLEKYRIEYENGIVQEKYLIPKECDYFTEKSPLGEGIKSGKLVLPETQGGTTKVKITKIKSDVKVINSETDNYWWCDRCERDNSGSEMCPCPRGSFCPPRQPACQTTGTQTRWSPRRRRTRHSTSAAPPWAMWQSC